MFNIFQKLGETVEKITRDLDENQLFQDTTINKFEKSLSAVIPETERFSLMAYKTFPTCFIGKRWIYKSSDGNLEIGSGTTLRATLSVSISEEEKALIEKGASRDPLTGESIMGELLKEKIVDSESFLATNLERMAYTKEASDSIDFISEYMPPLAISGSEAGTISDPAPLLSTALDLTAIKFSGTAETTYKIDNFVGQVKPKFILLDKITNQQKKFQSITIIIHPIAYQILENTRDKYGTTLAPAQVNIIQDLTARGFNFLITPHVDPTYTGAEGTTTNILIIADLPKYFKLKRFAVPDEGWTPFKEHMVQGVNGAHTFFYESHYKLMFALYSKPFGLRNADGAVVYYKPLIKASIMPFDNT